MKRGRSEIFGLPLIFSAAVIIIVFVALRFQLSERQRIAKKLSESNLQLRRFKSVIDSMPAYVMMAHKLGLRVIAEGVETIEQRDLLARIDCDHGQGYLFSKPFTPEEFEVNWKPICPD
jgi:EAL domain-containing protein (putative c-di-GMP-specific phosphodiesterase class I)